MEQGDCYELPKEGVYWARMTGHPYWPARYCSTAEAERMESFKHKKHNQVPIFFLRTIQVAWVPIGSVEPFTSANTTVRFDKQKFKVTRAYREAVVEAMRIATLNGEIFSPKIIELVESSECAAALYREDVCSVCGGSELSGDALLCDHCNVAETHLHCLRPQISTAPAGNWYCEACCKLKGLPRGYMPPPVVVSKEVVESSSSSSDEIEVESVDRSISPPTQVLVGTGTKRRKRGTAGVLSSKNQSNDTNSRSIVGGSILENLFRLSEGKELGLESRGLDLEKAPLDAKVGSLSTSLLGRSKGVYNGTVRPCSGHVFPENCLFCGQGGNLLLCDYPGCRRCYHQTCIPKRFPLSLSNSYPASGGGQVDEPCLYSDEPWICPSHFCVRCKSLSSGNGMQELDTRTLPSYLMINGNHAQRKALSSCTRCTLSVCLDCERDFGCGVPLVLLFEGICPETSIGVPNVLPVDINKIADNYASSTDIAMVFSEDVSISAPTASKYFKFQSPEQQAAVVGTLRQRVAVSSSLTEIATARSANGPEDIYDSFVTAGRQARKRFQVNYNDSAPFAKKLFGQRVNSDVVSLCLNCCSNEPKLLLARSLETMYSKICRSRLSLPFLRPLMPCSTQIDDSDLSEDGTCRNIYGDEYSPSVLSEDRDAVVEVTEIVESSSGQRNPKYIFQEMKALLEPSAFREFQLPFSTNKLHGAGKSKMAKPITDFSFFGSPVDLVGILEKIRRLDYNTAGQLLCDLENIVTIVKYRISHDTTPSSELNPLLWACDSLISIASAYDHANQNFHRRLEDSISSRNVVCSVSVQKEGDISDSHSNLRYNEETERTDAGRRKVKRNRNDFEGNDRSKRRRLSETGDSECVLGGETITSNQDPVDTDVLRVICSEFLKLWRTECEVPIRSAAVNSNYKVLPKKDLKSWCEYLYQGQMPPQAQKESEPIFHASSDPRTPMTDERSTTYGVASAAEDSLFPLSAMGKVSWIKSLGIEELASDVEAAQIMNGMRHSNLREQVSLIHCSDSNTGSKPMNFDFEMNLDRSSDMATDDNILLLDKLREISRQGLMLSVQIQERIRRQHRETLAQASTNITIGEGKLISELKLANDNLRWRLQQKQRAMASLNELIEHMKEDVQQMSTAIDEKDTIIENCKEEIKNLRGKLQVGSSSKTLGSSAGGTPQDESLFLSSPERENRSSSSGPICNDCRRTSNRKSTSLFRRANLTYDSLASMKSSAESAVVNL